MKEAYRRLFLHLEQYCSRRGDPIMTPGQPRWAAGDSRIAIDVLKNFRILSRVEFGSQRFVAWGRVGGEHHICLVGFDIEPEVPQIQSITAHSGFSMALLSELLPLPTASAAEVRNIVEFSSMEEAGYDGHDPRSLESLFPPVQVLRAHEGLDEDAAWRLFLIISAQECKNGSSWISDDLADGLASLTSLNLPSMPYGALCRSIFDSDPRSLFMAIYRCIEATYAYESSRKLVKRLRLQTPWVELAAALDEELGWHPQEAQSLNLVLRHALERDLEAMCDLLSVPVGNDLQASAGKGIYALRNRIVHYRPGTAELSPRNYDWNRVCLVMAEIVFHVFTRAYMSAD